MIFVRWGRIRWWLAAVYLFVVVGLFVATEGRGPDLGSDPEAVAAEPTSTTAPPVATRASVLVAGDVLIHTSVARAARLPDGTHDFSALLSRIQPMIAGADVAICHMEVPIGTTESVSGYPLFSAPASLARGMAAVGFDGCTTASNHSLDRGRTGVATTLAALDGVGLAHTGTGRTATEARRAARFRVGAIDIANLSYTYGTNGIPIPADAPWMVNEIDVDQIVADARRVRRSGADVVLVSLHWGAEYRSTPTAEQESVANTLAASGVVDVVVGHHAHVPQPIDRIGDTWVIYGLGNLISNQSSACCVSAAQDGLMVRIDLVEDLAEGDVDVDRLVFTPIRVDRAGYFVTPVAEALADPTLAGSLSAAELSASWDRTASVVDRDSRRRVIPSARP